MKPCHLTHFTLKFSHASEVGREVPGVVAVLCESIAGLHKLIAAKKNLQPAQSIKRKKKKIHPSG